MMVNLYFKTSLLSQFIYVNYFGLKGTLSLEIRMAIQNYFHKLSLRIFIKVLKFFLNLALTENYVKVVTL